MVRLTRSLQAWMLQFYPELISPIMFGHVELFTPEMKKEYLAWCQTNDGKRYLNNHQEVKEETK